MIEAVMIDGFGWFDEADYRRSWLFFDDVYYVLPAETRGPVFYPPQLQNRPDFRLARTETGSRDAEIIARAADIDVSDEELRSNIDDVPARDARYAAMVVSSDAELDESVRERARAQPSFAIAYLANKLLYVAARDGRVPIVGRRYASEILKTKLVRRTAPAPATTPPAAFSTGDGSSAASLAAGLSLAFVDDARLRSVEFEKLVRFKASHRGLLGRHQIHLVQTAQAFRSIPDTPDLDDRVRALRAEALGRRAELDLEAESAWRTAGFEIAAKAAETALAGAVSAIVVLRSGNIGQILVGAATAALAGAGIAAAKAISTVGAADLRARTDHFAYVFELASRGVDPRA